MNFRTTKFCQLLARIFCMKTAFYPRQFLENQIIVVKPVCIFCTVIYFSSTFHDFTGDLSLIFLHTHTVSLTEGVTIHYIQSQLRQWATVRNLMKLLLSPIEKPSCDNEELRGKMGENNWDNETNWDSFDYLLKSYHWLFFHFFRFIGFISTQKNLSIVIARTLREFVLFFFLLVFWPLLCFLAR